MKIGRANTATLTKNWIVVKTPFAIKIFQAKELRWVYMSKRTTTLNSLIKTSVIHDVKLRSKDETVTVPGDELSISTLLNVIHLRYPWVTLGYSESRENLWNSGAGQF